MDLYRAYGLNIASDIPLPELPSIDGAPDIHIRLDETIEPPPNLGSDWIYAYEKPCTALIHWRDVGFFVIQDGTTIQVRPSVGVASVTLQNYTIAGALNMLLFQRDYFLLHASVVSMNGVAVAFVGESGWGKSTLAAYFHSQGFALIADDTLVVDISSNDRPLVQPAFPQFKLWPKTLDSMGISLDNLPRVVSGYEKRAVSVDNSFSYERLPLGAIYLLDTVSYPDPEIHPITVKEAFIELLKFSYPGHLSYLHNFDLLKESGKAAEYFKNSEKLASIVPIKRLRRRLDITEMPETMELIVNDMASRINKTDLAT